MISLFKKKEGTKQVDIEAILEGTPFKSIIEKQKEYNLESGIMNVYNDVKQGRTKRAVKSLRKVINNSNLSNNCEYLHGFVRESWFDKDNRPWGGSYGHGCSEIFIDLCIVAGKLAKEAGYGYSFYSQFYQEAKKVLEDQSAGIGFVAVQSGHNANVYNSIVEWSRNLRKREEMIHKMEEENINASSMSYEGGKGK